MRIFAEKFACFKPSAENPSEMPKLPYVDTLFKRRLSQISRMTIECVHSLIGENSEYSDCKIVFSSFRGEICRQLKINKALVEDASISPANFSIAVFNTPPAVATIVCKMKGGYTVVFPRDNDFKAALLSAIVSLLSGAEKKIIFSYSDEYIPLEYKDCKGYSDTLPLSFACVLSASDSESLEKSAEILLDDDFLSKIASTPEDFLSFLESKTEK